MYKLLNLSLYSSYSLTEQSTLGKPGLERHIMHPTKVAVGQMQFITNKVCVL